MPDGSALGYGDSASGPGTIGPGWLATKDHDGGTHVIAADTPQQLLQKLMLAEDRERREGK